MKRCYLFIASAVLLAFLCSCAASGKKDQGQDQTHPTATSASEAESSPPKSTAKQDIETYLSDLGYEVVKTKESPSMFEFMVTLSGFSDQDLSEPPENWEEVRTNLLDAEQGSKKLSPDLPVILYLQGNDGNNYLTVISGKERYNAFETYSASGDNPPTITMEEYNAIRTGMTFQEVYDIIGGAGEVVSEVDLGLGEEYHTVMRQWDGEGSFGANANVTFQGGKVTGKAQFGLE